tara:strand:+ start:409 stop:732 length:324 start_codon:yes stop_codon:yes gene_type:complete
MIKKLFLTALLLCFCYVGFSQNTPEKMAKKLTFKMAKVLSLDEVQKDEVYQVQLDWFRQAAKIRKNHEAEPKIKKAKLKKVQDKIYGKMKAIVGKERMEKWSEFKNN